MGTPEFAATILGAMIDVGHNILAIYTQPPRPAGRGQRVQASPVQLLAIQHRIPVRAPVSLRDEATQEAFAALNAEVAVVAAYGLILPRQVLTAPRLGCLNVHASLLPRWRGAAPIQRAVLAGDRVTGVTIMQMDEGVDTGPVLLQEKMPIAPDATASGISGELAALGARLVLTALDGVAEGGLVARPQPPDGVTHAPKIGRQEGLLDWRSPSEELERRVRALGLWPGAFFDTGKERIRVHAAIALPGPAGGVPGTVLDESLSVACGEGVLRLLRVQRPGRTAIDALALLRGFPIAPGTILPCPVTS